eukprot:6123888-Prymnesium_polylepis.2
MIVADWEIRPMKASREWSTKLLRVALSARVLLRCLALMILNANDLDVRVAVIKALAPWRKMISVKSLAEHLLADGTAPLLSGGESETALGEHGRFGRWVDA